MTNDVRVHRFAVPSGASAHNLSNTNSISLQTPAQVPSGAIPTESDISKPPASDLQVPPSAIARESKKTKPPAPSLQAPRGAITGESDETKPPAPDLQVPSSAVASESDKTNPPLTDQQRAVARMLVMGFRSVEIARVLGLNHHTIPRWRRDPRVQAEMQQLRQKLDAMLDSKGAIVAQYSQLFRDVPGPSHSAR